MKFAKLSLAAAVALGTMTSVAAAKDLSEAIKGVDVSGLLRYEWAEGDADNKGDGTVAQASETNSDNKHDWEVNVNFNVPVSEEITVTVMTEFDESIDTTGDRTSYGSDDMDLDAMYATWKPTGAPVTVIYGKQFIGYTPWSDDDVSVHGTVALYTPMKELTLAGYYFDGHDSNDVDVAGGILDLTTKAEDNTNPATGVFVAGAADKTVSDEAVYGAGAIVNVDIVSADLFYARVTEAADLWAAHLGADTKIDMAKVGISGMYRASGIEEDLRKYNTYALEDGSAWGLSAYVEVSGVKLDGGWMAAEADEGSTAATGGTATTGITVLDIDKGSDFDHGEVIHDMLGIVMGEETFYHIGLSGKVEGFKLGARYLTWTREFESINNFKDVEIDEWKLTADYDFNKQFGVDTHYSMASIDNDGGSSLGIPYAAGVATGATTIGTQNYDKQSWEVEFDYKF